MPQPTSLPIDRRAPVERTRLDETSWVDVVRNFVPESRELFELLLDSIEWSQGESIREGRKIPNPRLNGTLRKSDQASIPELHFGRLALEARYRVRLHSASMVLYRDGRDSVGFHRDDEMLYLEKTVIAALCLGARRPVLLRPAGDGTVHELLLGDGDLYVLGGRCQADWLHAIPKIEECGPRIAAIWRWTSRLGPPSSSPTRFVADAPKKRRPR